MRLKPGPGSRLASVMLRKPVMTSLASVGMWTGRPTASASEPHRHDDVECGVTICGLHQYGAIGVRQNHLDGFRREYIKHIDQIADVEPDFHAGGLIFHRDNIFGFL